MLQLCRQGWVWRHRPVRPVLPRWGPNEQRLCPHMCCVPHLRCHHYYSPGLISIYVHRFNADWKVFPTIIRVQYKELVGYFARPRLAAISWVYCLYCEQNLSVSLSWASCCTHNSPLCQVWLLSPCLRLTSFWYQCSQALLSLKGCHDDTLPKEQGLSGDEWMNVFHSRHYWCLHTIAD